MKSAVEFVDGFIALLRRQERFHPPVAPIMRSFCHLIADAYDIDTFTLPQPATSGLAGAIYRDAVRLHNARFATPDKCEDIERRAFATALINFVALLPPHLLSTWEDMHATDASSPMQVPLFEMIDVSKAIEALTVPFDGDAIKELDLFAKTRAMIASNRQRVDERLKGKQHRGTPLEIIHDYVGDTPLEDIFYTPIAFSIPRATFAEHGACYAPSGHGKTQYLQSTILNFLNEPDPPALFIIDSMGAMLERIARLEVFNTTLRDRILILDPKDQPALNFFKLKGGTGEQQLELFFYLFKAIDQELTPRQSTMVSYLVELMQAIDGATLHTLRDVCEAKTLKYQQELSSLSPITQDFFRNQFMGNDALMKATKTQIAARLYSIGRNATFNAMFSARDNTFDAADCIAKKKIVLINTDRLALGEGGSAIFGRYILAQCLAAALARAPIPERDRHLALVIVDEAKAYLDEQAEKILSDARQFGLGMLLATQAPHQLPDGVQLEVANNTSIKMLGPIPYKTAKSLAQDMHTTPEFIMSMQSTKTYAEFACYVRKLTPHAIRLHVPIGALEAEPRMSDADYVELRARNRQQVSTHEGQQSEPAEATSTGDPSTIPEPSSAADTEKELSDIELVITVARRLESLLELHHGASGRGLHDKISSVEALLPPQLISQGRYIATMRNNVLHVDAFTLPDRDRFLRAAHIVETHFDPQLKPGKDW